MSKERLYVGLHVGQEPGAFVEAAALTVSPGGLGLRAFRLHPPASVREDWGEALAWALRGLIWEAGVFLHDIDGIGVHGPPDVEAAASSLATRFQRPVAWGASPSAAPDAWMDGLLATVALEAGAPAIGAVVYRSDRTRVIAWDSRKSEAWSVEACSARVLRQAWLQAHDLDEDADLDALAALGAASGPGIFRLLHAQASEQQSPPRAVLSDTVIEPLRGLSLVDGVATLVAFEAACITRGLAGHFTRSVVFCGPDRASRAVQSAVRRRNGAEPILGDRLGLRDEALAAMAAAANAAHALGGLPNAAFQTTSALFAGLKPRIARPQSTDTKDASDERRDDLA